MILFLKLCFKNLFRFFTQANYRRFLWLVCRHSGKERNKPFTIRLNGKKIWIIDGLSFVWQYYEIFTDEFYYFECRSREPVIFDVGSNIGLSILYFKKIYPGAKIYGFEPEPKAFEALKKNLLSFKIPEGNINLFNAAVWTHGNGINLRVAGADSSYVEEATGEGELHSVPSIRLKDLIEKEAHIDLIKMDIEGAEVEVLKDCAESLIGTDRVFVEYHSFPEKDQNLDELLKILKQAGFRVQIHSPFRYPRPFIRKSLHPDPELDLQINIFAYRKT